MISITSQMTRPISSTHLVRQLTPLISWASNYLNVFAGTSLLIKTSEMGNCVHLFLYLKDTIEPCSLFHIHNTGFNKVRMWPRSQFTFVFPIIALKCNERVLIWAHIRARDNAMSHYISRNNCTGSKKPCVPIVFLSVLDICHQTNILGLREL